MRSALAIGVSTARVGGGRVLYLPSCLSISHSSFFVSTKNGHLSLKAAANTSNRSDRDKDTFTLSRAQKKAALVHADYEDEDEDEYEDGDEYEDEYKDDIKKIQLEANKRPGFGHGKTYDTSLEEKLLVEIEQSGKAYNKTDKQASKVKDSKQFKEPIRHTALQSIPAGVNVRIGNLPRKKNITRNIKAYFKGYPGLLHINPVESGNKKTKDPICKGLAFLTFKNEDVADRFVTRFNGESISFGKIKKKISCCLVIPSDLRNSSFMAQTFTTGHTLPRLRIRDKSTEDTESLLESAIQLYQQKENHEKISIKSGNEHMSGVNEVNNLVRSDFSSIVQNGDLDSSDTRPSWKDLKLHTPTNSLNDDTFKVNDTVECNDHSGTTETSIASRQDDSHKDCVLNQDIDKGKEHSDNYLKISDALMYSNGERSLENLEKVSSSSQEIGKVDVIDYRGKQLEPPQQGSQIAQASRTQTWDPKAEICLSMNQNIDSIELTSNIKQRHKKKNQKERKSKEANSSDSTALLNGPVNRMKKNGKNILSAVLVKYGQNTKSTKK